MVSKPEIKLRREGAKVILQQRVEDAEINAMQLLNLLENTQHTVDQLLDQVRNAEKSKETALEQIEKEKQLLHDIKKHEEWALEVQESTIRAVVDEVLEECRLKVEGTYKQDEALDESQNARQMYVQLRHFVATHPKMAERVSGRIIKKKLFDERLLDNPWLK